MSNEQRALAIAQDAVSALAEALEIVGSHEECRRPDCAPYKALYQRLEALKAGEPEPTGEAPIAQEPPRPADARGRVVFLGDYLREAMSNAPVELSNESWERDNDL